MIRISYGEYCLRDMIQQDLATVLAWRNQPHVRERMFNAGEICWDEHREWFRRVDADSSSLPMIFQVQGRPVGFIALYGVGDANGSISWGFYLGNSCLPRGTGSRMLALAAALAFESLNVCKISAEVIASNVASCRAHEKLGFEREGLFHKQVADTGGVDVVVYGMLSDQWARERSVLLESLFGPNRNGSGDEFS